ncbi:TolC family protein [Comamonas composti]|uniref:TolC family protein n=1 Tax=Comamonas composti TaxID=408558 RepID=UPI0003FB2858|nr:TolC family protein [Comamonas composti]
MKLPLFARTGLTLATVLLLAGCASIAPDGMRGQVQTYAARHLPEDAQLPGRDPEAQHQARERIAQWLTRPLDADQAVRIALLNNPGLQSSLARLGVQDAQRVQSLTLPNPTLTLGRFVNGHEREVERELGFGLIHLITLPWRARWQGLQIEQASLDTAQEVLRLAADTRRAWLRAVAAGQQLQARQTMFEAAQAGAELAARMTRTGNFSRLQQAREMGLEQEASAQLARARLAAALERDQLARLMGLWGAQLDFQLPAQLPAIPKNAAELQAGDDAEATALRQRLDLRALRHDLDQRAQRQGWAAAGQLFGDIGLAYSRNTATEKASGHDEATRGWEIGLPLPLLDWGGAARGRARAEVEHSAARLREAALTARSEARNTWLRYRTAWDLAHQQQAEVLPLRRFMQEEAVLRYNGMFISTWELLAEARASTQAVATATEAQRDFWLADTDLRLALAARSPAAPTPPVLSEATSTITATSH